MGWLPWRRISGGGAGASWQGVDYMDLVPRHAVAAEADNGDGPVVLLVPRYRDAVWGRLLQPRLGPGKRFVRVPLEARGSALWRAIDGRRNVRDLVAAVQDAAPADGDDLPRRVCLYVQSLADNGFLALESDPEGDSGASGGS